MQWLDEAIILHVVPYGEHKAIAHLFTREHGRHAGMVHSRRKYAALCQPGNRVQASWNAPLEDQLGTFTLELLRPTASMLMDEVPKLQAISAACALFTATLPEREPNPELFAVAQIFLAELEQEDALWVARYLKLELEVLSRLGYGLELDHCAATGTSENLIYVSPKTGRAVSGGGGEPYKDKLLRLPAFLRESADGMQVSAKPRHADILDGFRLTGYFLNKHIFVHHVAMPAARGRLMEKFREENYDYA